MKTEFIALIFLSGALFVRGQGTFVWDQEFTNITDVAVGLTNQPSGQAFTPSESSMDAAAFYLSSGVFGAPGGDIEVNVRSGSITGTILGTSNPDAVSDASGVYYFTFASPIALTPGTQYYLQPVEISGNITFAQLGYANPSGTGQAIIGGTPDTSFNFFFEEGMVVPEPSLIALFLFGGSIAYWHRRKRRTT